MLAASREASLHHHESSNSTVRTSENTHKIPKTTTADGSNYGARTKRPDDDEKRLSS